MEKDLRYVMLTLTNYMIDIEKENPDIKWDVEFDEDANEYTMKIKEPRFKRLGEE